MDRAKNDHYKYKNKTLKELFYIVRDSVEYQTDNEGEQLIRSPLTLLKNGVGDCKSKTLFLVSHAILQGHTDIEIVFSSQNDTNYPEHVFCSIDGIYLDAVLGVFDAIPPNKKLWTYKIDTMNIYRIEGLQTEIQKAILKSKIEVLRKSGASENEIVKVVANGTISIIVSKIQEKTTVGQILSDGWGLVKKYNPVMILARNTYLGLMAINYRGNATKLKAVHEYGDQKSLRQKWESLGGNYDKLIGSVNRGYDKKALFGSSVNGIGEVATATGASVATASPILVAMKSLLVTLLPSLTIAGKNWLDSKTKQLTENEAGQNTNPNTKPTTNPNTNPNNNSTSGGIDTKTVLVVGGIGLGLYLLTKK